MGDGVRPDNIGKRKSTTPKVKPISGIKTKKYERPFGWTSLCLIASVLAVIISFAVKYYNVLNNTRLAPKMDPIIGVEIDRISWGAHRAHLYFGLRQKRPNSPLFGMMWYEQPNERYRPDIRHWCNQGNGISRYAWMQADGKTFGRQNITEKTAQIRVDWINNNDTWTARVSVNPLKDHRFNFIFYLFSQSNSRYSLNLAKRAIQSKTSLLSIKTIEGGDIEPSGFVWSENVDITKLNDLILENTRITDTAGRIIYFLQPEKKTKEGFFAAIQFYVPKKITFEITFSTPSSLALKGKAFTEALSAKCKKFEEEFENQFHLKDKGYTQVALDMAKVALSNMLGSVGYWYGSNKALDGHKIVSYGPHELISAVPSRPFFPRGFLWDEGFHNLLIQKFDPELSMTILVSWLNTMNEDGWIPREMILGTEAEAKVPAEFVTQYPNNANPPSMFIFVEKLIGKPQVVQKYKNVFHQVFIKLEKWYNWLLRSQKGKISGTMRWRGRNSTTEFELNPKTLASGLDDYPRASHPSIDEYHLDLRCWMAFCSKIMVKLATEFGDEISVKKYAELETQFSDYKQLLKLHWSNKEKSFFDYGLHSFKVDLVKEMDKKHPDQFIIKRKVFTEPKLDHVDDAFGYNSLFPLIFRLIPHDAPELENILDKIKDPEEIWTEYGLRSLSLKSRYYAARNTEHDPPYWRGYIWINVNYLVLSSLQHYASIDGPYKNLAGDILHDLRQNIIRNLAIQFNRTGYLWENYDDRTGEGRGSHPFNGWSSLILLIMDNDLVL